MGVEIDPQTNDFGKDSVSTEAVRTLVIESSVASGSVHVLFFHVDHAYHIPVANVEDR